MLDNTTTVSSALNTEQLLTVDTPTLCKLLCCGRYTAIQIGDLAHARMGHAEISTTLDIYAHITEDTLKNSVQNMSAKIKLFG